jgi:hypothetical protein
MERNRNLFHAVKKGDKITYKYKKSAGVFNGEILHIDDEKVCISAVQCPQDDYYAQQRYKQRKGIWYLLEELQFLSD